MSLPRYPEYKDSGVPWIGGIPTHWDTPRLKLLLREIDKRVGNRTVELLGLSKSRGVVPRSALEQGAAESDDYSKYKMVCSGDLVMNKMQAWNGVFGVVVNAGMVSPDYATFEFLKPNTSRYLNELLRTDLMAGVFYTRSRGMGTAFLRLNTGDLLDVKVPFPPKEEIESIADFLMEETAKIDALIAEQEKLIALLAEKRQATISQAVIRGLNPCAAMRESGVAWLGKVPTNWMVARLGLYARVENGTTPSRGMPEYWDDGNIPWLASGEVNQLLITEAAEFITAAALEKCSLTLLPVGTVVVGLVGQGKTRGMSALLKIPATINQNLAAVSPGALLDSVFVLHVFQAMYEWLREAGRGGNQAAMNCEMLSALRVPIPPVAEQRQIVRFIEDEVAKLESLGTAAARAIALLRERRSALIAAAVTGQIDVRGAVHPEAA